MMIGKSEDEGFALIAVMMMISVMLAMLGSYFLTTNIEIATTRSSKDSIAGFYAAEAGLNIRAEQVRTTFVGYNRPSGTSPSSSTPCLGGDDGTGDYTCQNIEIGKQDVSSYVVEAPGNPLSLTIPPGELYQNLSAQEYRYSVSSIARGKDDRVEAMLELRFKSRLVPLFQFAAFYDKDLEIAPGPLMTLAGPVHTNGDLYLHTGNALHIQGQVTSAGSLYRGTKRNSSCLSNPVTVIDPTSPRELVPGCSSRTELTNPDLVDWNGMIEASVDQITVPGPEIFDPSPGALYWDSADLRLVLKLTATNNPDTSNSVTAIEVHSSGKLNQSTKTSMLNTCSGGIGGRALANTSSFYNNREGKWMKLLDLDMQALLDCLHTTNFLGEGKALDDSTHGGLVFFLTVDGPNSLASSSGYGVRIRNAGVLQSSLAGAPSVKGLSIISDQGLYTYGDYNQHPTDKIPASLMADTFNVLSSAWLDSNSTNWSARNPVDTVIRAAVLSGTDSTGGIEGSPCAGSCAYNGGLENYPRFHEHWAKSPKKTLTYRGSFVSLNVSRRNNGAWNYGDPQYTAPNRDFGFDTDFSLAENLPPITPRFVYLRQELFVRDYEQ